MNEQWKSVVIKEICGVAYVPESTKGARHLNRPCHILVLNDSVGLKEYVFDDGRVMRVEAGCLFYLPKGSSYSAKVLEAGCCYAISFDADVSDDPFVMPLRNYEKLWHNFKTAEKAWKANEEFAHGAAMRALYDAIYRLVKEKTHIYVPSKHYAILTPALEVLKNDFTSNDLSVSYLSSLCGISDVYFRRLFLNLFGVLPKEYIIQRRIEYAKTLLQKGGFSISEISELCGYSAPCHFSREFSRREGVSPSEYAMK